VRKRTKIVQELFELFTIIDEVSVAFIAALATLFTAYLSYLLERKSNISSRGGEKSPSYSEKLSALTTNLTQASREVDTILHELTEVSQERAEAVRQLEAELEKLEAAEKEQKQRIEELKQVPIPAVEHLLETMKPSEQRSERRDYLLFGAGVVVSTVVSIILSLLFN
jgi:septal ring factor EnvC (AmiA/AmiB activator)